MISVMILALNGCRISLIERNSSSMCCLVGNSFYKVLLAENFLYIRQSSSVC